MPVPKGPVPVLKKQPVEGEILGIDRNNKPEVEDGWRVVWVPETNTVPVVYYNTEDPAFDRDRDDEVDFEDVVHVPVPGKGKWVRRRVPVAKPVDDDKKPSAMEKGKGKEENPSDNETDLRETTTDDDDGTAKERTARASELNDYGLEDYDSDDYDYDSEEEEEITDAPPMWGSYDM